jgi:hypothetical protein
LYGASQHAASDLATPYGLLLLLLLLLLAHHICAHASQAAATLAQQVHAAAPWLLQQQLPQLLLMPAALSQTPAAAAAAQLFWSAGDQAAAGMQCAGLQQQKPMAAGCFMQLHTPAHGELCMSRTGMAVGQSLYSTSMSPGAFTSAASRSVVLTFEVWA